MRTAIVVLAMLLAACGGEDESPSQTSDNDAELEMGAACGKLRHNCANDGRCGYDGADATEPTCLGRCTVDRDCGTDGLRSPPCDMANPAEGGRGWCGVSVVD